MDRVEYLVRPEADVSHVRRKWLDVAYADVSPAQRLDIFLPDEGDGPFPVLLRIHGGAFAYGDKRDIHVLPFLSGLPRGYAVASVNYRLSGEATFPAGIQDVKAAIRWLRAHAADYLLDGRRVVAWGDSSGGNYAAMVCVSAGVGLFDDPALGNAEFPSDVQVGVDWFGPTDFLKMDEQLAESGLVRLADHRDADSPESLYLGGRITDLPEKVRMAGPITYLHPQMPPILIQHGRADFVVPVQQSLDLARAIDAVAGPGRYELDIFEGAGHEDPIFESAENLERVFAFIGRHLGPA